MNIKASACAALIVAAGIMSCLMGPLLAQESTGQAQTAASSTQPVALGKPIALNKYGKHRSRHARRHARKSSRTAKSETKSSKAAETKTAEAKSSESKSAKTAEQAKTTDNKSADKNADAKASESKTSESKATDNKSAKDNETVAMLSASVVNARAQLLSPKTSNEPSAAAATAETRNFAPATKTPAAPSDTAKAAVAPSDRLNDVDRSLSEKTAPAATIAMASLSAPPSPAATTARNDDTWAQTSLIGKIFIAFGGLLTLASAARMMIA